MAGEKVGHQEDAAYHEAGHAVVCWSQGRAFQSVSIVGGENSDGSVRGRPPGEWFQPEARMDARTRRRVEQEIQVAWGGTVAQAIHEGLGPDSLMFPFGGDFEQIVWYAGCVVGPEETEQEEYAEGLRMRVWDILSQPRNWRAVEALVEALLERNTLNWRQARAIMNAAATEETGA